jgi:RNA 3'-terminal phosphate cyclase (ATP)
MRDTDLLDIDGAAGEGGGQVLRTALALSLITGRGFTLRNIRGGRARPGLQRQHLTCVEAARVVGHADVDGAGLGARFLRFVPGTVRHGDHRFAIGTAGSTSLVLQTILWPLLHTAGDSTVVIEGGTHVPMAPTATFLERAFLPALDRFGLAGRVDLDVDAHGFFPAGGGRLMVELAGGAPPVATTWTSRGATRRVSAHAMVSQLSKDIARREVFAVAEALGLKQALGHRQTAACAIDEVESPGPGNALHVTVESEHGVEVFQGIGERGRRAEDVAAAVVEEVQTFLAHDAPVGPHLADQLLIPMALAAVAGAGESAIRTTTPTLHTTTNADLIGRFLPVAFDLVDVAPGVVDVVARRVQ